MAETSPCAQLLSSLAVVSMITAPRLRPITQQLFFTTWSGKDDACDFGIHVWCSCHDPSRAKQTFLFSEESQSASGMFLARMTCFLLLRTEGLQALQELTELLLPGCCSAPSSTQLCFLLRTGRETHIPLTSRRRKILTAFAAPLLGQGPPCRVGGFGQATPSAHRSA